MNAQEERDIKNIDSTPEAHGWDDGVKLGEDADVDPVGGDDDGGVAGFWLKNLHNSSCVASEGTFPDHITHSDRCAGGLG